MPRRLISIDGVSQPVMAEIIGPFGVHRMIFSNGERGTSYRVTHLQTGFYAANVSDRQKAITVADALNGLRVSWDFTTADAMPKLTKRRAGALLRRMGVLDATHG